MCLIAQHAHVLKRLKEAEAKIAELEAVLSEYHEIIETGWDYPDVTLRLPKSRDIIPKADIQSFPGLGDKFDLIVKGLPQFWIADVADTLSEDPFFGIGHNVILAKLPQSNAPYRYEDLAVGDSAVYQLATNNFISHQIVKIEIDGQGRKYTFRGRNTANDDPYIVRDINIKYLIIAIVF